MARRVFFSFHYDPDKWRVAQIRNIGAIEGNKTLSDNAWEAVKQKGDNAIKKWIDEQLMYRSCTVVLVGEKTANRKWINYEINESWKAGKGVVGIHIYKLKDENEKQSQQGKNPFDFVTVGGKKLSTYVKLYDSSYKTSTYVYSHIQEHIADWVEEAIQIRNNY